jgi:hypothetical protein
MQDIMFVYLVSFFFLFFFWVGEGGLLGRGGWLGGGIHEDITVVERWTMVLLSLLSLLLDDEYESSYDSSTWRRDDRDVFVVDDDVDVSV